MSPWGDTALKAIGQFKLTLSQNGPVNGDAYSLTVSFTHVLPVDILHLLSRLDWQTSNAHQEELCESSQRCGFTRGRNKERGSDGAPTHSRKWNMTTVS